MATATGTSQCIICQKERNSVRCEGCFQIFCYDHLNDHRQELGKAFDEIIGMGRDVLSLALEEGMIETRKHHFIERIEQWELDSITIIKKTAQECREKVLGQIDEHFENLEMKYTQLTDEISEVRRENDFNEIDISRLAKQLKQLGKELNQMPNISIQEDSNSYIKKLNVVSSAANTIERENIVLKVILIGDSAVGKSSLLRQYLRKPSDKYNITTGVEFFAKEIRIDNRLVTLQIWDTCGNESFRDVTATYYAGADGCMLVYDVTSASSFQSLDTWREHFLSYGKPRDPVGFPFVVIGTNADLENRVIEGNTARNWCKDKFNIPYFEISRKENINLVRAFKTLARNALARRKDLDQTTKILSNKQSSASKGCYVN